jgi:hypothetical protein
MALLVTGKDEARSEKWALLHVATPTIVREN